MVCTLASRKVVLAKKLIYVICAAIAWASISAKVYNQYQLTIRHGYLLRKYVNCNNIRVNGKSSAMVCFSTLVGPRYLVCSIHYSGYTMEYVGNSQPRVKMS